MVREEVKDFSEFRNRLTMLIESRGLSLRYISSKLGITNGTLSRYLTGTRSPELVYVIMLADFFDVSVDWLIGLSDFRFGDMTGEVREMAHLYTAASSGDRKVVQALLSRYRNGD